MQTILGLSIGGSKCTCTIHQVNLRRVEQFIQTIGDEEETIFQKRARIHQVFACRSFMCDWGKLRFGSVLTSVTFA